MARKRRRKRVSIYTLINYFLMLLIGLAMLFPFYVVAVNSVSPPEDYMNLSINLWPTRFDTSYYKLILSGKSDILVAYRVTLFVTIVGTALNMFLTAMTAFALTKREMPFRTGITLFFVFTMFFGGGMIPTYIVINKLKLLNTYWVMILPSAIGTGYVLFLRNFFFTIPNELFESAALDGCSEFLMLMRIVLPLSLPALATFTLFYAVGHWNDFYSGIMYITKADMQPLQVYLHKILYDSEIQPDPATMAKMMVDGQLRFNPPTEAMKATAIMCATLPIICVYPFLQKYFVKGMLMGSLKG